MVFSVDIPELFYSSENKKPITHCAVCGKSLFSDSFPYLIEKAFKKNQKSKEPELIFEYALCFTCQQNTSSELSKESLENIRMYFDLYVDIEERKKELLHVEKFNFNECVNKCIITKIPISAYNEYQIGGYFFKNLMLLDNLPFAIGEKAIDEIQEIISKKTRDFLEGFKDKILPVDTRDKVPEDFLILI